MRAQRVTGIRKHARLSYDSLSHPRVLRVLCNPDGQPCLNLEIAIPRPQRWDEPFGEMTDARRRSRCCGSSRFAASTRARFRRRCRCAASCWATRGSLATRRAIWSCARATTGTARFWFCRASVRVVLERLDPKLLGRDAPPRRGWRQAIAQLWQNARLPEVRQHRRRQRPRNRRKPQHANRKRVHARVSAGCAAAVGDNGHRATWAGRNLRRAGGAVAHAADGHGARRAARDAAGNSLAGAARLDAADAGDSAARRAAVSREQPARSPARDAAAGESCRRMRWKKWRPRRCSNRTATSIGTPTSARIGGATPPSSLPPSRSSRRRATGRPGCF